MIYVLCIYVYASSQPYQELRWIDAVKCNLLYVPTDLQRMNVNFLRT